MGLFDKLSNDSPSLALADEIVNFLKSKKYEYGGTVYVEHDHNEGYCRWYYGEIYDTHVCISNSKVFFFKETKDESFSGDKIVDITEEATKNLGYFIEFLNEVFEDNKDMFDSNLVNG